MMKIKKGKNINWKDKLDNCKYIELNTILNKLKNADNKISNVSVRIELKRIIKELKDERD
jgi:hypothetical protein